EPATTLAAVPSLTERMCPRCVKSLNSNVQDERVDANDSIVVCPLTTDRTPPTFRFPIPPNSPTGLRTACRVMVDKLTAVPRKRLGTHVGKLNAEELSGLNRAIFVFLRLSETEGSRA